MANLGYFAKRHEVFRVVFTCFVAKTRENSRLFTTVLTLLRKSPLFYGQKCHNQPGTRKWGKVGKSVVFTLFTKSPLFREFFWPHCLTFLTHPLGLDRGFGQWPIFLTFWPPLGTTFWTINLWYFPIFYCAEPPGTHEDLTNLRADNSEKWENHRKW